MAFFLFVFFFFGGGGGGEGVAFFCNMQCNSVTFTKIICISIPHRFNFFFTHFS